jgi:exodeoxyribonuclease V beta subunit
MGNKKEIWEQINYNSHTVIEASAGTGKTYTLEHIVLELIINHGISINEILIVTFTEKAAGEIKERIRKIIASEFDRLITEKSNNQNAINKLKIALDIFDSADISTIHGFCKKILSQYAFENNTAISQELSQETYTNEAFNNIIQSKEFSSKGGIEILKNCFENGDLNNSINYLNLVKAMNETALDNVVLADYEEVSDNGDEIISTFETKYQKIKKNIASILGIENFNPEHKYTISKFYDLAGDFAVNGKMLTNYQLQLSKYDQALTDLLSNNTPIDFPPKTLTPSFDSNFTKENFLCIDETAKKKKQWQYLKDICPELFNIYTNICNQCNELSKLYSNNKKAFQKRLINLIYNESKRLKEEHQTLTFDDLIINLDNALQPNASNSVALINALRSKYKIALIDEFQDTDALQWDIFSRIFTNYYEKEYPKNSFSESQNSLIVVGDPKQAIYKFRGADLNTYFLAKHIISEKLGGQVMQLDTTYRCTNEMVDVYNTMFRHDWFIANEYYSPKNNLEYLDVKAPLENSKSSSWFPKGFSTVNIVSCQENDFKGYITGCAAAITELINTRINENEVCKLSDFCFLVSDTYDALSIAKILKAYKLPYTYKKDVSLYDSVEANGIITLLKFLLEPNNRKLRNAALLTDFFDADPRSIGILATINSLDLPNLQKWVEYLNSNKWEKLFHSMFYDSGLYFRLCRRMKKDISAEIKLGIYNQLFEELLVAAKEKQLSIYEFPSFLKGIRNLSEEDGDDNSLKKVTEDPRIQIMTMHASKGLEFKFVFYCGGFKKIPGASNNKRLSNHYTREKIIEGSSTPKIVNYYFNMDNLLDHTKRILINEDICEIRRLTYVAITRAQYMLFCPSGSKSENDSKDQIPLNYRSNKHLLGSFIGKALQKVDTKLISLYKPNIDKLSSFFESQTNKTSDSDKSTSENCLSFTPIYDLPNLMRNKISLDSFSSINQHHKEAHKEISFDDENEKEDDETIGDFTVEKSEIQKATTLLPPGATFGKCFHEIMEQLAKGTGGVDFKTVATLPERYIFTDKRLEEIVAPAMQKYGIVNQYIFGENDKIIDSASNELKRMVWNTLNTPIQMLGEKTLGSIQTADMKAELEFYINKNDYLTEEQKNNIMIGFIDLLFRVDGKYYILDWKTNMLQGYDSATVLEAMEEANYTLQHEIYSVATIQWLEKLFGTEASNLLGGSIYMFVRGGASNLGEKAGCYEKVWSPDGFASVCERIKSEINQAISFEQQNSY